MTKPGAPARTGAVVNLSEARVTRAMRGSRHTPGTLAHAWEVWTVTVKPEARYSKRTVDGFRCAMGRILRDMPDAASPGDFETWVENLRFSGMSVATANWYLRSVIAVLSRATRAVRDRDERARARDLYDAAREAKPLREQRKQPRCPPKDTLLRVIGSGALRNIGERAFVLLAGVAGLRVGEILGLEPRDYNPSTHQLFVTKQRCSAVRKNKSPLVKVVDCDHTHSALVWTIRNHHTLYPRTGKLANRLYLFPWGETYVDNMAKRIRAGLPEGYLPRGNMWHAFRHLMASTVDELTGGDTTAIMEALGDRSPHVAGMYSKRRRDAGVSRVGDVGGALLDVTMLQVELFVDGAVKVVPLMNVEGVRSEPVSPGYQAEDTGSINSNRSLPVPQKPKSPKGKRK